MDSSARLWPGTGRSGRAPGGPGARECSSVNLEEGTVHGWCRVAGLLGDHHVVRLGRLPGGEALYPGRRLADSAVRPVPRPDSADWRGRHRDRALPEPVKLNETSGGWIYPTALLGLDGGAGLVDPDPGGQGRG